jgi:Flp pilus assembly protein CpaB
MANNKSTRIIAIGVAVFVVGGALLFLVLRGNNGSKTTVSSPPPTTSTTVAGSVSISPVATTTPLLQFKIPTGYNAVAVPMDYFAGGGGYVRTGDQVNIYTVINKDCADKNSPAAVKLLLSNVKVLEVLGASPAPTGAASSFLLALTPQQAEMVIFHEKFEQLYFTLTTNNEANATTTGITCANSL